MPKLRYNPKTKKVEPEVMTYGKDQFQPQMPMQAPSPMVDQNKMIRQPQQERSLGVLTAANAYAPAPSGDPFMDKIKAMLASGAPAVTNTEEFQKTMPEAYAGNKNLQDLQDSYARRYQDAQIAMARPGYTDEQIAAYQAPEPEIENGGGKQTYTGDTDIPEVPNTDIGYWGVAGAYPEDQVNTNINDWGVAGAYPQNNEAPVQQPIVNPTPTGYQNKIPAKGDETLFIYTDPVTGEKRNISILEAIQRGLGGGTIAQSAFPQAYPAQR